MELLPLCVCVLMWAAAASAEEPGPEITVIEGHDVTLPCSISEDITAERFDWRADGQKEVYVYDAGLSSSKDLSGQHEQFKGRVSHFPGGLKDGNASIKISNTKVSDSGKYSCEFRRTNQTQLVKLLVGAAPKPSVTILNQTKDLALLQCEVYGAFPEPEVQWKDSAGNIIPAEKPDVTKTEGKYNIILQTTVTKTDYYRCVSTQETIRHQIDAKIFVLMNGSLTGWIVAAVFGSLFFGVVVVLAVLRLRGYSCTKGSSGPSHLSERQGLRG
ncbi:butyrophilin subfamily 1 member A1-like [Echeneis naucrates]|uniref:butyrophilin subfamily 1 member A1-like n=1 Tax=Echeneis naucrates TaxID=173247 RepID=UPI0011133844|nr:butyrophilin subfamily 1 member A1-like [Echeneis naucrates]